MSLIPVIPGSRALPLGGYYGTQPQLPYGAVLRGNSNVTAFSNGGPMSQDYFNKYGPTLSVTTYGVPGTKDFRVVHDSAKEGTSTLDDAVSKAAMRKRASYGFTTGLNVKHDEPSPTTTPLSSTTPPPTTSLLPPPATTPPQIPTIYDRGIYVPHANYGFTTITNQTNIHALTYPIWVTINEVNEDRLHSGVKPPLRGQPATNPTHHTLVSYRAAYMRRGDLTPDVVNDPFYKDSIIEYKSYDCEPTDITSNNCIRICDTAGDLARLLQHFRDKFKDRFLMFQRTQGGKGVKKNVYSRRKLNKTKSKRKTTKRRRSLRIRRNIIRKTKKMYK